MTVALKGFGEGGLITAFSWSVRGSGEDMAWGTGGGVGGEWWNVIGKAKDSLASVVVVQGSVSSNGSASRRTKRNITMSYLIPHTDVRSPRWTESVKLRHAFPRGTPGIISLIRTFSALRDGSRDPARLSELRR